MAPGGREGHGAHKKPRDKGRPRGNHSAAVLRGANGQTGLHAELLRATKKPRARREELDAGQARWRRGARTLRARQSTTS